MAFGGRPVPAGTVVKAPTPANPQQGIIAGADVRETTSSGQPVIRGHD
jgi:hypothetical protein